MAGGHEASRVALNFFGHSFAGIKKAPGPTPKCLIRWWAHQDSNLEPRDYESPALTVEL